MKKIFTRNSLTTLVFLFCSFAMLQAQLVNTLTIDAPAGIAGDYTVGVAPYGQQLTATTTGFGIFADNSLTDPDNCDTDVMTNVSGKIAFIDRGACQFSTKSLAAENAGAIVAVICNNDASVPDLVPGLVAGDLADMVSLPTLSMSYNDCNTLRMALESDVEMTIRYRCNPPTYGPEVIWGRESGEGDFSEGLNDWFVNTMANPTADSTWYWEPNGNASGAFTGHTIASPTQCNGAMVFCSDYLDNAGTWPGDTGSGAGGCAAPCYGELVSPTIDLTQFSDLDALFLDFNQAFRHFAQTQSFLLLSKNGGITYPDTILLNGDAVVNAAVVDESVRVPLFGYESAQSLTMKFAHTGNYYFWSIDDVRISNLPSFVDVQLNSNWYAAPVQWKSPANQIPEQVWQIDMFNNGNLTADVVSCTVNINDESGTSVYSQTTDFSGLSVPGFTIAENEATTFPMAMNVSTLAPGTYTGSYTVDASAGGVVDSDPSNNTVEFTFVVTENVMSNAPSEQESTDSGFFALESNTDGSVFACDPDASMCADFYGVASHYYIRTNVADNGLDHTFTWIQFGVTEAEATASGFIDINIYRLPNGDANLDQSIAPDERELVGATSVVVDTVGDKRLIRVPVWRADATSGTSTGEPIQLEANSDYMVAFVTRPLTGTQIDLLSYPASATTSTVGRNWYHFPAANAYNAAGNTRFIGTSFQPLIDGTANDFASTSMDIYTINTLYNELTIGTIDDPLFSGINDLNENINLSVFPNPVSNMMNIGLALDEASDVNVEVFDIQGRKVLDKSWDNLRQETIVVNTASLVTGKYSVKITTAEGFVTKSIVVEN